MSVENMYQEYFTVKPENLPLLIWDGLSAEYAEEDAQIYFDFSDDTNDMIISKVWIGSRFMRPSHQDAISLMEMVKEYKGNVRQDMAENHQ